MMMRIQVVSVLSQLSKGQVQQICDQQCLEERIATHSIQSQTSITDSYSQHAVPNFNQG